MGGQSYSEEESISAIREGNTEAYRDIFELYYARLCRYTSNLTYSPDQAEDIVQEIFINFWNNRKNILITTSLKSYLYKACYYKYIDTYRKEKRVSEELEKYRHTKLLELDREATKIDSKKIDRLNQAIESLPPRCKEIFILSKHNGLKYKEIAEHLEISKKTVENQIGRAYSLLRQELSKTILEDDDTSYINKAQLLGLILLIYSMLN